MKTPKLFFPLMALFFLMAAPVSGQNVFDDQFQIPLLPEMGEVEDSPGFGDGDFDIPDLDAPAAIESRSESAFTRGINFGDNGGDRPDTVAQNNPLMQNPPRNPPGNAEFSRGLPEDMRPAGSAIPVTAPPRRQDGLSHEGAAQLPPPTANQLDDIFNRPDHTQIARPGGNDEHIRSLEDSRHPFYGLLAAPNDQGTQIQGTQITLSEILAKVQSPAIRGELIKKYWELSGAMVVYNHRAEYLSVLSPIQNNSARTEAAFRLGDQKKRIAELNVLRKQHELAALLKQNGIYPANEVVGLQQAGASEKLPLPCDYPLMNPYKTKASELLQVGHRPLSQNALLLDKTLPLDFLSLEAHKEAVLAANQLEAASRNNADMYVMAAEQSTEAKIEYAKAIIDYNCNISDYVAETVGPEIQGRRLLTTIILLPKEPANEVAQENRPTLAPNPIRERPNQAPTHFANAWQGLSNGQVRPVGGEVGDERGNIVPAIRSQEDLRGRYNSGNPIRNGGEDRQGSMIPRERNEAPGVLDVDPSTVMDEGTANPPEISPRRDYSMPY